MYGGVIWASQQSALLVKVLKGLGGPLSHRFTQLLAPVRDVGKTGRVGASRLARALYTQSLGLSPAGSKPNSLGCCLLLVCCTPEPDQKHKKPMIAQDKKASPNME